MAAAANEYVASILADDAGASVLRASLTSQYSWPQENRPREKSVPRQIGAVEFRIRKPIGCLTANLGRVGGQATDKLFSERITY